MQIQPTNTYTATYLNQTTRSSSVPEAKPTSGGDRSTISQEARDRFAAQPTMGTGATFDTGQGPLELDIDKYFSIGIGPSQEQGRLGDSLPPLLLPSQRNIDALTQHISSRMQPFLAQNGISAAPESITYDSTGKMILPEDYAYADQFREALENEPVLARELRMVSALSSHVKGIQRSLAFQKDYAAATNQAQIDAVIGRYQDLFAGKSTAAPVALNFSANGTLSVDIDG